MGSDGCWTYWGGRFVSYVGVRPVCCTCETDVMLYVNCNWKIKMVLKREKDAFIDYFAS